MNQFDWENFLKAESRKLIAEYQQEMKSGQYRNWHRSDLTPEEIQSEWLGLPGASDVQIAEAEARLGVTLPDSYKSFLKVTNGWSHRNTTFRLMPVEEIEWFQTHNSDWIDIWEEAISQEESGMSDEEYLTYNQDWRKWDQPIRIEYMRTTLQISDAEDVEVILLNPLVMHNGEWEAWIFSSRHVGINRWQSFGEMLQQLGMTEPWS